MIDLKKLRASIHAYGGMPDIGETEAIALIDRCEAAEADLKTSRELNRVQRIAALELAKAVDALKTEVANARR